MAAGAQHEKYAHIQQHCVDADANCGRPPPITSALFAGCDGSITCEIDEAMNMKTNPVIFIFFFQCNLF